MKITEEFIKSYFDIEKDKIKITVAEGSSYYLCSLKDLFKAKYGTWELIKKILKKIVECRGAPSLAGRNYDNLLLLLAFIEERNNILDLEIWRDRFNSKHGI